MPPLQTMKSLTVKELEADKLRYEQLLVELKENLVDQRQQVANTEVSIFRAEGAWRYVSENLKKLEAENAKASS